MMATRHWFIPFLTAGLIGCAGPPLPDFDEGLAAYKAEDYRKAAGLWRPLAETGHARAQLGLAKALMESAHLTSPSYQYLTRDQQKVLYTEARDWLHLSAEQGHPDAQFALGELYSPSYPNFFFDADAAIHWYKRAARQGHEVAMYTLGIIYDDSRFKDHDEVEAKKWFIIYSQERYGRSFRTAYPVLTKNIFQNVTDEEREEAERRAKAWNLDRLF